MSAAPKRRLSIQVVTWNSADVIDGCLASILAEDHPDVETIVVDNASRDGSAERADAWIARGLRGAVVRAEENLGFCGGQNLAFRRSEGDLVLLLNPDARLTPGFADARLAPGFAARAIALGDAADPEIGIFAPRVLLPDGRIDSVGLELDRLRRAWDRGAGEPGEGAYLVEEDVFGATGAAALLRRTMVRDVAIDGAVLDERIFAYCDDVDLAWRARLRGWRCRYAPSLVVEHGRAGRNALRTDAGRPRRVLEQRLMVRNRLLVIAKCEGLRALAAAAPLLLAFELARIAFLAWRAPRVLGAYRELAALLPAALRDRARIQRRRQSDARIPLAARLVRRAA
ncbi:MAG TPA: glycosyltransferase family 2 protein [Candidatus Binatia bacterium]|nr:glycosyltransferase family 2 protein [Candidatus Binatia bacterium]